MEIECENYISSLIGQHLFVVVDEDVAFSSLSDVTNYISTTLEMKISTLFGIVLIAFGVSCIISAVMMIIVNEFFIHKLSKQMRKVTDALDSGTDTELKLGAIRVWFIVIGAFSALSALSMVTTFALVPLVSEGASAVVCFALAAALNEKEAVRTPTETIL